MRTLDAQAIGHSTKSPTTLRPVTQQDSFDWGRLPAATREFRQKVSELSSLVRRMDRRRAMLAALEADDAVDERELFDIAGRDLDVARFIVGLMSY